MALYHIAVLGRPTRAQVVAMDRRIAETKRRFKLDDDDIRVDIDPAHFSPDSKSSSAAIFFGGKDTVGLDVASVLDLARVPVLPVASTATQVSKQIPLGLRELNCVFYRGAGGADRVFSALLECLGMLPRQRRVFLSYRRNESTPVAVQLFAELSARQYEVFLDTHSIGAGVDFQEALWHSLCDVDVLVMLDSPQYFDSRWTAAEYGRALAKGIGVLRVQWPTATPSKIIGTSSLVPLATSDFRSDETLEAAALDRVCDRLEDFRSLAHATRHLGIVGAVEEAVEKIGGEMLRTCGFDALRHADPSEQDDADPHPADGRRANSRHSAACSGACWQQRRRHRLRPRWHQALLDRTSALVSFVDKGSALDQIHRGRVGLGGLGNLAWVSYFFQRAFPCKGVATSSSLPTLS